MSTLLKFSALDEQNLRQSDKQFWAKKELKNLKNGKQLLLDIIEKETT